VINPPKQFVLRAKPQAGLPASPDVGELAKLIAFLRSAVEAYLGGRKISGAVATIPHLAAMYQEDLEDAFEYVDLSISRTIHTSTVAYFQNRVLCILVMGLGCAQTITTEFHAKKKTAIHLTNQCMRMFFPCRIPQAY
jgi:hypothetical protein